MTSRIAVTIAEPSRIDVTFCFLISFIIASVSIQVIIALKYKIRVDKPKYKTDITIVGIKVITTRNIIFLVDTSSFMCGEDDNIKPSFLKSIINLRKNWKEYYKFFAFI